MPRKSVLRFSARPAFSSLAILLCLSVWPGGALSAASDPGAGGLQQFTSAGHALGFEDGGYFTSNGTYALRVRFEGAPDAGAAGAPAGAAMAGALGGAAPALERVSYQGVWPGVDVEYDAPAGAIARSTWTVAPGADPGAIRLRYNRPVELTAAGELQLRFETGVLTESAPIAWQDIDGTRRPVEVAFAALESDLVGFAVGDYRTDLPLVIDPTLLWNTFLGGSGEDAARAIAVDASGNVYVGGASDATWGGPVRAHSGDYDAFVAKLDASGALLWNTFLGVGAYDEASAIGVDASGNVYVGGYSEATWGSPLRAHSGGMDAFVAKLDASGGLDWNTFLGGSGYDAAFAIAVDASGNVYVGGESFATWGSPERAYSGDSDAFAAKLDASGALVWNTFLGGSEYDVGDAIAVDASGNVYVGGYSDATWGSPERPYSGDYDAFVAKLDASGTLVWNTFLGGSGGDAALAIAVDASGNVYVGGDSEATWGSPVRAHSGGYDAFVAKLDASGTLDWNTFLGSSGYDAAWGIEVDASGNVYVGGYSDATWGSPVRAYSGFLDPFAAKLDASGTLDWNTFAGGSGYDAAWAIAVDASGNVYVGGDSEATWGSPVRAHSGGYDAFAAKLGAPPSTTDQAVLGKSFWVRDATGGSDPQARQVGFHARERGSSHTIVGDPSVDGATLEIIANGTNATSQTFNLPASGWRHDTRTPGTRFTYRDPKGTNGAVKKARIRRSGGGKFSIRAVIDGRKGTVDVVPPDDGTDAYALLTIGGGDRYCVQYGADGRVRNRGAVSFRVDKPKSEGCPVPADP